ncbi:MAG TPA: hypothetical protein VEH04_00030 [Verrucomicrobiae bacterium]|nr:hypothetical protein [Verrucomicrobiae bacterium]
MKLTSNQRAKKVSKKFQIDWSHIVPLAAIARSGDEKIRRFHERQEID